jgi:GNAT superfamily N-acetyltransferase
MNIDDFTGIRLSEGIIYLLEIEGKAEGMVALRKLGDGVGEINRMYIRPEYRGRNYGKLMLNKLIDKGREFGYSIIRLDTVDFMTTAQHIYRSAGFTLIYEYSGSEIPEWLRPYTVFMEKKL